MTTIPCKLVETEKSCIIKTNGEKKFGIYSQTNHNISGFGIDKWVISAYLEIDNLQSYLDSGMTEEDLLDGCAKFLSTPPEKKKYQKKEPKSQWGNLKPLPAPWKGIGKYSIKRKLGFENRFIVEFIIDDRKNPNYWDEGPNFLGGKILKKRGRKKKED